VSLERGKETERGLRFSQKTQFEKGEVHTKRYDWRIEQDHPRAPRTEKKKQRGKGGKQGKEMSSVGFASKKDYFEANFLREAERR